MNNTVLLAKSTFSEGLIMDFSPDNTLSSTLTSALNATLLTFNGNELSLLNDMGNGRVETAYLPEGYIPVGTCEFGDIIYIVSYNPIKNKSLIGCFPSPERNVSNTELGGTKQVLKASDFLKLNDDGIPTGKLVASSCKKIIYSKDLNPGDKYIISGTNLEDNKYNITDYGNVSHKYGDFIKKFRIHIVSIEESGKITYLDNSVKWYSNDYILANTSNITNTPDIEDIRSQLNSGYSIFLSKVSGKLALLIELEKINSFNCTYEIFAENLLLDSPYNTEYGILLNKIFKIYWYLNWESNNEDINPSYIVLTKSKWSTNNGIIYPYIYNLESGEYAINYVNGGVNPQISIPKAYDESDYLSNTEPDYWFEIIESDYNDGLELTYESFLEKTYKKSVETFINSIKTNQPVYNNLEIYKINIEYKDSLPNLYNNSCYYYINAQSYKDGKYYTTDLNGSNREIKPELITDSIVNNYFKGLVCKKFVEFQIPYKLILNNNSFKPDISNLIYNYAITPAMSYGLLDEFTLEGFIDFSKVGSGEINLTDWRYYNTDNICTLTLGLNVYPEPNKGVAEITIDFYDNLGIAATYRISNKVSYSGLFTEYIPLNSSTSNYKLSNKSSTGETIYHAGVASSLGTENILYRDNNNFYYLYSENGKYYYINEFNIPKEVTSLDNIFYIKDNKLYTIYKRDNNYYYKDIYNNEYLITDIHNVAYKYSKNYLVYKKENKYYYKDLHNIEHELLDNSNIYSNDAGILYSNILYLTKITVKYCSKNSLGLYNTDITTEFKLFYRWFWTNNVFNELYYNTKDFDLLVPILTLDVGAEYSGNEYWENKLVTYFSQNSLASIVQSINQDGVSDNVGNINSKIILGLLNTFGTFSIDLNKLNDFQVSTIIGKSYIKNSKDDIEIKYSNTDTSIDVAEQILPNNLEPTINKDNNNYLGKMEQDEISSTLTSLLNLNFLGLGPELWDNYNFYKNRFSLNFPKSHQDFIKNQSITYLNQNLELIEIPDALSSTFYTIDGNYLNNNLVFSGIHFSKYYKEHTKSTIECELYIPILNHISDLENLGLLIINGHLYFKELIAIGSSREYKKLSLVKLTFMCRKHQCNDEGTFSNDTSSQIVYELTSNGNHAIMNGSKAVIKVPNTLSEGYGNKYFKEIFNYNIVPILYCNTINNYLSGYSFKTKNTFIKDVYADGQATETNASPYKINTLYNSHYYINSNSVPISTALASYYDYDKDILTLMGLAIKDSKGDIHIINAIFPVKHLIINKIADTNLYKIFLTIEYNELFSNPVTIGDVVGSILSNIYIKSSESAEHTILLDSNVIYLEEHNTQFILDIVYKVNLNNSELAGFNYVLMNGFNFKLYLDILWSNTDIHKEEINNNNINIQILEIVKNIPILLNMNYLRPSTTLNLQSISAIYRKNTNIDFALIDNKDSDGPLYIIRLLEDKVNLSYAGNISSRTLSNVTVDDNSGYLIYLYDTPIILENKKFSNIFTYQDGLVLKLNTFVSKELGGLFTDLLRNTICGISIYEYLTTHLKYLAD